MIKIGKYQKSIVILLGLVLIAQTFVFSLGKIGSNEGNETNQTTISEDDRIAAELSNMTGVTTEEILKYKNLGLTWNQVVERLKNEKLIDEQLAKELRSKLLAVIGLGEDYLEELMSYGYSSEEIMEAKLLVERVLFQLQEITESSGEQIVTSSVEAYSTESDEELTLYKKIAENFDTQTATYLLLMLKEDFGGFDAVLDEYLFSLQIDLNLQDYINDKEKYLEAKNEKAIHIPQDKIITLAKIEEKMLEKIQQENTDNAEISLEDNLNSNLKDDQQKSSLPEIPTPNIDDVKPKNPADEIMEEIKVIDPNK